MRPIGSVVAALVSNAEIINRPWHKRLHNKKIAGYALRNPTTFESFSVYCLGEAAGLAAPFFPPLPAFTSTSVADIV